MNRSTRRQRAVYAFKRHGSPVSEQQVRPRARGTTPSASLERDLNLVAALWLRRRPSALTNRVLVDPISVRAANAICQQIRGVRVSRKHRAWSGAARCTRRAKDGVARAPRGTPFSYTGRRPRSDASAALTSICSALRPLSARCSTRFRRPLARSLLAASGRSFSLGEDVCC